jgi:hypothetical protein
MDIVQSPLVDFGDSSGFLDVLLPHVLNAGGGQMSYNWQDSSTDSTYTVTSPGTYSVTVTGHNSCQTMKTVRVNIGTFIYNTSGNTFRVNIYPNPANDIINLEFDAGGFGSLKLEVINANGQVIHNDLIKTDGLYNEIINISGYLKGIYYIRISNKELIHVSKVIIY